MIREYEGGRDAAEICREHSISRATFYNWRKKYSGMESHELKRLKELEAENTRLKKMYAHLSLDHTMLKDVLSKKF
jgi:putative transposase